MKICIAYNVQPGPWGGGNSFFSGLIHALEKAGHRVVQGLEDSDIDFILLSDPRFGRRNKSIPFSYNAAWRYVQRRNPDCIIVHRINECDERKNTKNMNRMLKLCNEAADHTVFVGSWLKDLDVWLGTDQMSSSVILNGADLAVYNSHGFNPWDHQGKLKLVTHHWAGNWMKGFDIYDHLDKMLFEPSWANRIDFTYIGNLPKGYQFRHAHHISPLSGQFLADALRKQHAYVTGSINEPGGNHQNEGAQCGLPVLYLASGCMPEYLGGYGLAFHNIPSFEQQLEELLGNYDFWQTKISSYPHNLRKTCTDWLDLFTQLNQNRRSVIAARHPRMDRLWFRLKHGLMR